MNYTEDVEQQMKRFYETLSEKDKRAYAAVEVAKLGHGGTEYIAQVLGCDPKTIRQGRRDLSQGLELAPGKVRRAGGGRKKSAPCRAISMRRLKRYSKRRQPGNRCMARYAGRI